MDYAMTALAYSVPLFITSVAGKDMSGMETGLTMTRESLETAGKRALDRGSG